MNPIDKIPAIVERLYAVVAELEEHFPGRKFTPDGHLIGSLGEVLAAYHYGLELLPASTERHDARTLTGQLVQVKATQGKSIALRSEPDHLLVLSLLRDGTVDEVYNGPGKLVWERIGKPQKNGQFPISLHTLRKVMSTVLTQDRLPRRG